MWNFKRHKWLITLTLLSHACFTALAQAALLALAAHVHVHLTAPVVFARVLGALDDTAAEEALAALTAQHIVVETRSLVPTNTAHFVPQHLRSWSFLPLHWLAI